MCGCNKGSCSSSDCCDSSKSCGCSSSGCCASCQCGCQQKCGCGSSCSSGSCAGGSCSTGHGECCEEFGKKLLCMADQAWMDVLHCKLKKEIEAHCGAQLEEIARVVSTANKERWKAKMAKKEKCSEYSAALAQAFHSYKE